MTITHEQYVRLMPLFISECEECIYELDEAILSLARNPADSAARTRAGRAAHTIAGNAAAMGHTVMLPDAQAIEMICASMGGGGVSPGMMRALMNARTALRRILAELPLRVPGRPVPQEAVS